MNVSSAKKNTVWIAEYNGTQTWHANSTKFPQLPQKKISNSSSLLKEKSSNSVQNVNFGLKRIKDATIWLVSANLNSAISVEEFTWNANVFSKWELNKSEGDFSYRNEEDESKRVKREQWKGLQQRQLKRIKEKDKEKKKKKRKEILVQEEKDDI